MTDKHQPQVTTLSGVHLDAVCGDEAKRASYRKPEQVQITRWSDIDGVEVWQVRNVERRWRVCHWAYTILYSDDPQMGANWYWYRSARWQIPRSTVAIFAPGEVHACDDDRAAPNFSAVTITPERMARRSSSGTGMRLGKHLSQHLLSADACRKTFNELFRSMTRPDNESLQREQALEAFLREVGDSPPVLNEAKFGRKLTVGVQRARELLHEHLDDNPSLDRIAAASGLSKFYLERAFVKHVGVPLFEYRRLVRIGRALELIRRGVPLIDVSLMTGFADQGHLTRVMKSTIGVTPGCYRNGSGEPGVPQRRRLP